MTTGDRCFYAGASAIRFDLQAPAEPLDSFPHTHDADASRFRNGGMVQNSFWNSFAVVSDRDDDSVKSFLNLDDGRAGLRMKMNIRETGLHNAEDRKFGLGFQIASSDPKYAKFRSVGSMSWAGIYNTEFWIDPKRQIGVVMMMQVLPFYDEGAIRTLRDFEELVYQKVR